MKSIALLFIVATMASGCHYVMDKASVQGSGKSASRAINESGFSRIQTNGAFDLEIRQGTNADVKVVGDDNLVKLVKFKNEGGLLSAYVDESYSSKIGLKIIAVMPKVEGVEVNGSGSATISDVSGDELELAINGSGDIKVLGDVKNVSVNISGSGAIDASGLAAKSAAASIDGSGTIRVDATDALSASVSGSGEILYKGNPKVSKAIDGSGEVEPM